MSGKKAGFITGANAKLKIGGNTVAYATDLQYREDVQHIPIYAMGKIDAHAYEPVGYTVSGTFSVIRYTKKAAAHTPAASTDNSANSPALYPDVGNQMDPGKWLSSNTVDIELFERTINDLAAAADTSTSVIKILDCRLTRRGISLTKRGVMSESFQFVGEIIQDSGQAAAHSGKADLT